MAAFHRGIYEDFDEFSGQNFQRYVDEGTLIKNIFYVNSKNGKLIYTVFTVSGELWRFHVYKSLKKSGINKWTRYQEYIEGILFGYCEVD